MWTRIRRAGNGLDARGFKGHMNTVQSLLEKGANVNANRQDGMTALTLAVFFGHVDVVNVLLNKGADPRTRDCHGASAMDWASSRGYPNIVRLLKDAEFFKAAAPEITGHTAPHIITSNEAPPALNPNERLPDDLHRESESARYYGNNCSGRNIDYRDG
jgi:ankyrin repeat protein